MINRIIDFSINNKFIVGLLTLVLLGAGIWSAIQLPLDAVPDITNNQVQVITRSPDLGTVDIEQFVTHPVEVAMGNLPHVSEIRSVSRFGLSVVTIVFDDAIGTYLPRQLVAEKLPEVQEQVPAGFGKPTMGPISTGLGEIFQYTLAVSPQFEKKYTLTELRTVQDWIIKRQMAMVPGVVEVNAFGGNQKQYEVAVDPHQLRAMETTILEVYSALEKNNGNIGGAYIERDHQAHFIRGEGLARTVSDIENTVVKTRQGIPVRIRDLSTVTMGSAVRYGALTKDGKGEAVGGMILMLKGENSNEVIQRVTQRMEQIQKSLPEGISIVPFLDRSQLISQTIGTVRNNLLEGGLIVIFVLVLLLGNWRGGLIVASTIPLSLLFAFILMNIFDVWANLMSLGAIDFGIIVDGTVIIVEGTVFLMYSHMTKHGTLDSMARNRITATASKTMMNTAFFGQLIILIVFLPILALQGVEGKMFRPMALTFVFAMLGAMILCLTYVPMVSSLFLRIPKKSTISFGDKIVHRIEGIYEPLLLRSLRKGKYILGATVVLFALAIWALTRMGGEFIPQLDEGDIAFHALLRPGSSLTETVATTTKLERILKSTFPEVETVISRIGVAEVPTDPMPMDMADVFVILRPKEEWVSASSKETLLNKMKEALGIVPGVNFEFTQPIEMRFNELLTGVREDVAVKLFGEDLDILADKAAEMGKIIAKVPGVADMKVEAMQGLPQITIGYDRDKVAQYGLDLAQLNRLVRTAFAGGKAGVVFEGEKRFDLVVRLQQQKRSDIEDVKNLFINLPNGAQIPLREVANVVYREGPMQISRDNTNRRTYVGINIRDRDVRSVVGDIKARLETQLTLPPGYYIRYGGAFENLERASDRLQIVVPIALLLIFVLIYFALRSFPQTLMIYLAIPMATIGGVFALAVRDLPFSISAGVGFIVLFGVAVLNGLVMIGGLNELKREGMDNLQNRIILGTKRRIRPILLTALTDILGFLPMAISSSAGAEVQRPLATVVIGGLFTSTLLTLFVLPILYQWVEKKGNNGWLPPKYGKVFVTVGLLCFFLPRMRAQQRPDSLPVISLEAAVALSRQQSPQLRAGQLEMEKRSVLMATAYDLGNTQLYTAGEELGHGSGTHTLVGVAQQNMDLLGIAAKKRLLQQQRYLAESTYDLSERQLEMEVRTSWSKAFQAKRKWALYTELDTLYTSFLKSVTLNFKEETISRLEYAAAKNQALQIVQEKQQAHSDYLMALQRLNLWLDPDIFYTVPQELPKISPPPPVVDPSLTEHPAFLLSQQRVQEADAKYKVARTGLLPKLSVQGGMQQLNGQDGFYSYQAGISFPFLSGTQRGKVKAAELDREIARTHAVFEQRRLGLDYQQALQTFLKWENTWQFYRDRALPLAGEQRKGALFAYRERALDHTAFAQLMHDAIETEMEALDALENYLSSLFHLTYYKKENYDN